MFIEQLKIPKQRVAVLIGTKARTKKQIEKLTKTKLKIDSEEGDVIIKGSDSLNILITKNIIQAIGRGFNPEIALELLNENYSLEIIEIKEFSGKSKNKRIRLKGRVIGQKGKARTLIEKFTNTNISVYGKTICIIGQAEDAVLARQAIELLLKGTPHGNVYKYIEKQKKLKKVL